MTRKKPGKARETANATVKYRITTWRRCDVHRGLTDKQFADLIAQKKPLACCNPALRAENHNLIVDNWHSSIQKQLLGTDGAADDLTIDYIAIGTGYTTPAAGDTGITTEIYRAVPTTGYTSGNKTTIFILTVPETTANPAFSGTTTATVTGTAGTTTVFNVGSGEGSSFTANDRIRVSLSTGDEYATISSKATDQITLTAATALTSAPQNGDAVAIMWGCVGLFGGSATATSGSGTLFSHALVPFEKDAVTYATVEAQHITASVT